MKTVHLSLFFSIGKKLNFCAITEKIGTDTKRVKELTYKEREHGAVGSAKVS